MNKKAILGIIFTLSLTFSGLNISSAFATDTESESESGIMPISETEHGVIDCAPGYVLSTAGTCVTPEEAENILDEGTSGEPEVVCADKTEPGCEDTNSTPGDVNPDGEIEAVEPETWPLIVSLSALGATVVFVIIINLFGRKK